MRIKEVEERKVRKSIKDNLYFKRFVKTLKIIMLLVLITLIYLVSERLANYIQKMDITNLKIIINLIFTTIAMYVYKK